MDAHDQIAFRAQLRSHLRMVLLLAAVIAVNVGVAFLPLDRGMRVVLHVGLAVVAGGIVLLFFMHLLSEKPSTFLMLGCTAVLFAALIALPIFAAHNHPLLTESYPAPAAATNRTSHVP